MNTNITAQNLGNQPRYSGAFFADAGGTNTYKHNGFPKIEPNPANVPEELKQQKWAVWRAEPKPEPGKYNKAPRNPNTGIKAGANDPDNFGSFDDAVKALESGRFSGFGPVLDGSGTVGVDIDDATETLKANPAGAAWLNAAREAGAYCEVSPSGKGLRLFVRGKLPGDGRKSGPLEIYDDVRFITFTGKRVPGFGTGLTDGQELVDKFLALLPEDKKTAPAGKIELGSADADPAMVEQLIARMRHRQPELMAGQYAEVFSKGVKVSGYNNRTPADLALVGDTVREALRLGIADDALPNAAWQVYAASGLYLNDEDQVDRERKIVQHTIRKALAEEFQKRNAGKQQVAELQESEPEAAEALNGEPGDTVAGQVFANKMRGKLLFVAPRKNWMRWDGQRFALCEKFEEMVAAKHVAGKILDIATAQFKLDSESPRNKKLLAFAASLQNLKRQQAMLEMTKSEEGMTVGSMTALDADPWLLGVRNGVVNLRDGGLLAADPKMLITRQAAAEYRDDAQCPRWLEFLDQVFQGDQETIDYLQRALGYTLTGTTREEVLFICFGHGANGKSVFGNVVSTIMADYGQAAPPSLLTARRADDNGARGDIARMCGARLASINELQGGDRLDEQVVKMLAGREQISARFNYGEFFDFWPTAKPWLRTNHKPVIVGEDEGIWRRLHLIPFRRKFAEDERNPYLEEQLLEERDGILRWMVQGCLAWQRHGLKPSATVRRESTEYRKDSDLLGEFLDDRAVMASQHKVERGEFFTSWRLWCEANGYRSSSQASISRRMTERGFVSAKTNGKRYYTGVGLVGRNSGDPVDLLTNLPAEATS